MLKFLSVQLGWLQAIVLGFMSFSVNNLVPGGLGGDVLRAWIVGRKDNCYAEAVGTVLFDRWLSFLCLTVTVIVMSAWHWRDLCGYGLQNPVKGALLTFLLGLAVSMLLFVGNWPLSQKLFQRFSMGVSWLRVSGIMASLLSNPMIMLRCFMLTMITPLIDAYVFYSISEGLGLGLPLWVYMLMVPVMRIIHHVPVSVNAVGTQDAACLFYLSAFGVSRPEALTVSLGMHAIKLISACICGCIYLALSERAGVERKNCSPLSIKNINPPPDMSDEMRSQ